MEGDVAVRKDGDGFLCRTSRHLTVLMPMIVVTVVLVAIMYYSFYEKLGRASVVLVFIGAVVGGMIFLLARAYLWGKNKKMNAWIVMTIISGLFYLVALVCFVVIAKMYMGLSGVVI